MKRQGTLIATKKLNSVQCTVAEKIKKNFQKWIFFSKNYHIGVFSWFFQQRYIGKSWGFLRCNQCVLALHLSYQTPQSDDLNLLALLEFFVICLTGMHRSSDSACSKHDWSLKYLVINTLCLGLLKSTRKLACILLQSAQHIFKISYISP